MSAVARMPAIDRRRKAAPQNFVPPARLDGDARRDVRKALKPRLAHITVNGSSERSQKYSLDRCFITGRKRRWKIFISRPQRADVIYLGEAV